MLRRLAELLPGERIDGAVFAQTGPRPGVELLVALVPMLGASFISWYLGLAWILVSTVVISLMRRWVAIAVTEREVVVCRVFKPRPRVLERLGHEALHEPDPSRLEPSITVGATTYWLRMGQLDEARRMARAARAAGVS